VKNRNYFEKTGKVIPRIGLVGIVNWLFFQTGTAQKNNQSTHISNQQKAFRSNYFGLFQAVS
jgi:hypothetical protein